MIAFIQLMRRATHYTADGSDKHMTIIGSDGKGHRTREYQKQRQDNGLRPVMKENHRRYTSGALPHMKF